MNKADVNFIKQAFKNGTVEERGVHLRETSMALESCQQPITGDKSEPADITPNCCTCGSFSECEWRVGSPSCRSNYKPA